MRSLVAKSIPPPVQVRLARNKMSLYKPRIAYRASLAVAWRSKKFSFLLSWPRIFIAAMLQMGRIDKAERTNEEGREGNCSKRVSE